jgi:hypothetical protein
MRTIPTKTLNNPKLLHAALKLQTTGYLLRSVEKLIYLDIDDTYIHQLFPLLRNKQIKKPNYFGEDLMGAHISVIYPEENILVYKEDLNQVHEFTIKEALTAKLDLKKYYLLTIESPSLLQLRRKYGLTDRLCFRSYWVDFHITIGVSI